MSVSRLQVAGLATFDETDATCCYARQDKIWAHDPDGNEWGIYLLTDDLENDNGHDHTEKELMAPDVTPDVATSTQPAHRRCR